MLPSGSDQKDLEQTADGSEGIYTLNLNCLRTQMSRRYWTTVARIKMGKTKNKPYLLQSISVIEVRRN